MLINSLLLHFRSRLHLLADTKVNYSTSRDFLGKGFLLEEERNYNSGRIEWRKKNGKIAKNSRQLPLSSIPPFVESSII